MSATSFEDLKQHVGHKIACVTYGPAQNVAIECETCNEVLSVKGGLNGNSSR